MRSPIVSHILGYLGEESGKLVYHATHQTALSALKPRPVRNLDTLGTFLDESPEMARKLYGPNVFEFELPPGKYIEVRASTNEFFFDKDLVAKHWSRGAYKKYLGLAKKADAHKGMGDEDVAKEVVKVMRRVFDDEVYRSAAYMKAFREDLERQGYDGIRFVDSTIDTGPSERHTVYVLFAHPPLVPLRRWDPS